MKPNNNTSLIIALIIALAIVTFFLINTTDILNKKIQAAESKAKEHERTSKFYQDIYDMQLAKDQDLQASYDSLLLEKQKIKYYDKIKLVNRYSVSDMQSYFNERTK